MTPAERYPYRKHPDTGRKVAYDGAWHTVWGVSYSARTCTGGIAYHLMPEGKHSLKDLIQYIPASKILFELPTMPLGEPVAGNQPGQWKDLGGADVEVSERDIAAFQSRFFTGSNPPAKVINFPGPFAPFDGSPAA